MGANPAVEQSDEWPPGRRSAAMGNLLMLALFMGLFACSTIYCTEATGQASANLLASGNGFKIEAMVQFWPSQGNSRREIGSAFLSETYSLKNRRALIEQRLRGSSSRKYYVSEADRQPVKVSVQQVANSERRATKCELLGRGSLVEELFKPVGGDDELVKNWLEDLEDGNSEPPDYFVGLTRLLLIFDAHRNQSRPISHQQKVREVPTQRYDLKWRLGEMEATISALVAVHSLPWKGAELPLRMWLTGPNINPMMVDFYTIEPLADGARLEESHYHLDPTTIELGVGCSALSENEQNYPVFHEIYSMELELVKPKPFGQRPQIPNRREFVAFDGRQRAFRRDTLPTDSANSLATTTIYDLKRNIKFNIRRGRATANNRFVSPPDAGSTSAGSECVTAPIWLTGDTKSFMPFGRFVKMGAGSVRGVQVVIFEHVSETPPEVFNVAARYLNQSEGRVKWDYVESLAGGLEPAPLYSVVYYFTPPPSQRDKLALGGLVRMDLMANRRLLERVDVFKFAWHLTGAPNGDKAEQLFSVPVSCYNERSSSTAESSLRLQLEYQTATKSQITEQVAQSLFGSVPVRSKALLRSLSEQSDALSATRVVDIETTLRQSEKFGDHFKLYAELKLALGRQISVLHQPALAARVAPIERQLPNNNARSYEDCFYEAARKSAQGQREVLFAFIQDACYIDSDPIFERSRRADGSSGLEFTYSNVFRMTRSATSGHLAMRITVVKAEENEPSPKQLSAKIYDELHDKRLVMPIVDANNPQLLLESLLFKIDSLSLVDQSHVGQDQNLLKGLGLINARSLVKNSMSDVVDHQSCKAVCLSDLSCRSYSICTRGRVIDCRLSEINFDDTNLLRELDKNLRTKAARHQISLDFQPAHSNSSAKATHLELILDRRCQIYRRRALQMFNELAPALTSVSLNSLVEVEDQEECADLCLRNNIAYFSRYRNFNLVDGNTANVTDIKQHHSEGLKEWCSTFRFLNLRTSSAISHTQTGDEPTFKEDGLCSYSMARHELGQHKHIESEHASSVLVEMDVFEFNYVNLYEMRGNTMMKLYYSDSADGPTNKRQVSHTLSLEECARACFWQTTELVPYCKSFEFTRSKVPTSGVMEETMRSATITQCTFNSMSISDAIEANLFDKIVETRTDVLIESWNHYEPHKAYLFNSDFMDRITSELVREKRSFGSSAVSVITNLFIVLIALMSGLYVGTRVERPIANHFTTLRERIQSIKSRRFSNGHAEEIEQDNL